LAGEQNAWGSHACFAPAYLIFSLKVRWCKASVKRAPQAFCSPTIPYSKVQPGFVLKLKAFVLPKRGKKQEGNKEGWYEGREVLLAFPFLIFTLK
jgi:hypothetical protein